MGDASTPEWHPGQAYRGRGRGRGGFNPSYRGGYAGYAPRGRGFNPRGRGRGRGVAAFAGNKTWVRDASADGGGDGSAAAADAGDKVAAPAESAE